MKEHCAAVFCGSASGDSSLYQEMTEKLGTLLVKAGISLVYGGGNIGLMGTVAQSVLQHGGKAYGVIPGFLIEREKPAENLTELTVTDTMHTRKQHMFEHADAFLILPGGFGTMDELFEILTWKQLGLHKKPIIICNFNGFYAPLIKMITHITISGFAAQKVLSLFHVTTTPEETVNFLQTHCFTKTAS